MIKKFIFFYCDAIASCKQVNVLRPLEDEVDKVEFCTDAIYRVSTTFDLRPRDGLRQRMNDFVLTGHCKDRTQARKAFIVLFRPSM
jgi:hypothetical protein